MLSFDWVVDSAVLPLIQVLLVVDSPLETAVLRLVVDEIAPLRLLLIWLSEVETLTSKFENWVLTVVSVLFVVLSTVLTAVLRLVVSLKATEVAELKAVLIEALSETACVEIAEETCALVSPPPPAALDWNVAGMPWPLAVRT